MSKEQNKIEVDTASPVDALVKYPLMIKDDMVFVPYMPENRDNAWQCKMQVSTGVISVRFDGSGLFTNAERPYEVWYPENDTPTGYQTADDIWGYINSLNSEKCT